MSLGFTILVLVEIFATFLLVAAILNEQAMIALENRLVRRLVLALRRRKKAKAVRRRAKLNAQARFTPEIPPYAA